MNDVVIQVENLSKRYRIGEHAPYRTLRDALARAVTAPFRRTQSAALTEEAVDEFWALKDVSFQVARGEVIGIIGRNGAGKSTLMRILSRVTRPTLGHARIHGRLGSLLDVGTGFHPELTGRENTYMNGAILGMSKRDIARQFDEIVAFAEIEKFIDTPVKYYSSGMYVRLAFSVAAHLEPEILLVDEVLAVGDVAFQKKCLGRMGDAAKHGRTVLFVSHNMGAMALLCNSAIVLDHGRVTMIGDVQRAIGEYMASSMSRSTDVYKLEGIPRLDSSLRMEVEILTLQFESPESKLIPADRDLAFLIEVRGNQQVTDFNFNMSIRSVEGIPIGSCSAIQNHSIQGGEIARFRLELPNPCLAPGCYSLDVGMAIGNERSGFRELDFVTDVLHFEVMPPPGQDGTISEWQKNWGAIRFRRPSTTRWDVSP